MQATCSPAVQGVVWGPAASALEMQKLSPLPRPPELEPGFLTGFPGDLHERESLRSTAL